MERLSILFPEIKRWWLWSKPTKSFNSKSDLDPLKIWKMGVGNKKKKTRHLPRQSWRQLKQRLPPLARWQK